MEQAGIEVLGALPRREDLKFPERHLGLIQAIEHPDLNKAIDEYAGFITQNVNLERIVELAQTKNFDNSSSFIFTTPPGQHIALAHDKAFSFTYPHLILSLIHI